MTWVNFDDIMATIGNAGSRFLSAETIALCLHAITLIEAEDYWHDENFEFPSVEKYDEIKNAITVAIDEIATPVDCSGETSVIGEIKMLSGSGIPANCLLCDGTQYAKVDYPELYDVLAAAYIIDADYFTVPDLRNKFTVGIGTRAIGDTGGAETHTLTEEEIPSHRHTTNAYAYQANKSSSGSYYGAGTWQNVTGYAGGGEAHNNLPPYHALAFVIVASE